MASQSKVNDPAATQEEVEKVQTDLSELTERLSELGSEKAKYLTEELVQRFEDQIDELSARISTLTKDVKVRAEQVDTHIKANPYLYLLGAAGIGFLLGKTLPGPKHS